MKIIYHLDMLYICLDTCSWIYLANGKYPDKVFEELKYRTARKEIKIIVPEIVVEEWNRNKTKAVKEHVINMYESKISASRQLREYLNTERQGFWDEMHAELSSNRSKIESEVVKRIKDVDDLFSHSDFSDSVKVSQHAKNIALELALAKKAPFKTRNSIGDALILMSAIEHVKKNGIRNSYFITENKNDFCDSGSQNISSDLSSILAEAFMNFELNIGKLLNSMAGSAITSEIVSIIRERQNGFNCPVCGNKCTDGGYRHSQFGGGLTWHMICGHCNNYYDTGDYWD